MEKTIIKEKNKHNHWKFLHIEEIIKLVFKGLIPIVLLAGGLILLDLRITGWSLVFGFPIAVIGAAMLIFAYDEIVSKRIGDPPSMFIESKFVKCSLCGEKTPRVPGEWEEDTVCLKCKAGKTGLGNPEHVEGVISNSD